MRIDFTTAADADLLNIYEYLVHRNRRAASDLASHFNAKIESLIHFPFIGRDRSVFGRDLRSIAVENYLVFYRVETERILIVRVLDGRRDIEAEFHGP